jgi:DNA-binding NarL/FixJ family response regulator
MMRAYAILARRGKLIWCIWSGLIAALPPRQPLLTLSLACAALLLGRTLGAADKASSEKCRRFMAIAGAIVAIPIFALEALTVEANTLADFAAAEIATTAFAFVGWICLSLEFAHTEPNGDAVLQSAVILGIAFVVPLVLNLSFPAIGPWLPVFSACLGATASLVAQLLTRLSSGTDERMLFSLVAGLVFSASLYDTLSSCPHLALVLTGMHLSAVTVVIVCLIHHAPPWLATATGESKNPRQIARESTHIERLLSSHALRPLSGRETEVLISTALGKPRRIIAQELGVSESTVNTNRSRGYEKLGIRSKQELCLLISSAQQSNDVKSYYASENSTSVNRRFAFLHKHWSTLTYMGLCLACTLCPFDASSQLVTAHVFGLALICGALIGFLCYPDSGGEEALRQRLGVSPTWEKSLFAATGTTLAAALLVASWPLLWLFRILSLLVLFATVLLIGTNVALPGAEISWTHRTRHLLQTGIQELFCRSRELAALVGFCFLLQRPIDSLFASHPDVPYGLCALLLVAGVMIFGKISPTTSPDGNPRKDADVVLKHLRGCGLNELQAQIALLIARGDNESEICNQLHIARGTVKSYRSRIYVALGIHSAAELQKVIASLLS